MSRSATRQPRTQVALILLLGSAGAALGSSVALPGLRDFVWTEEARAGRDLIRWFSQLSGGGSDILPAGILFVLPVFAARWLLRALVKRDPDVEWEERHSGRAIRLGLLRMAQELALVILVAAAMGGALAFYLAAFVLPHAVATASFAPSATLAVVAMSILYFVLVRTIDGFALVDGAAVLTFCGAAATLGGALGAVLPDGLSPSVRDVDVGLARALLLSALAVPLVIVLLLAQRRFSVTMVSKASRKRVATTTMPFRLVPAETLRLTIGMMLWTVTSAMVVVAAVGHMEVEVPHALDWLLFPAQPMLIGLVFYALATGNLRHETEFVATKLRRADAFLPGLRPGGPTEAFLDFSFRRMLAAAAIFAATLSALVAGVFWLSGASALESLQGLAWIWTIGASAAALLRGIDARTELTASAASLVPRMRWSPARAQFTLLCITALIDRTLAPEEKLEAMALGARTRAMHEVHRESLLRWLTDIESKKNDQAGLMELAGMAIADYPQDALMRRAVYAQCADIAHADRTVKIREHRFLAFLAKGLRLSPDDRKTIDAVLRVKNRH